MQAGLAGGVGLFAACSAAAVASGPPHPFAFPPAPRADVVDDYGGVRVADPYRPLEDLDAGPTRRWRRGRGPDDGRLRALANRLGDARLVERARPMVARRSGRRARPLWRAAGCSACPRSLPKTEVNGMVAVHIAPG